MTLLPLAAALPSPWRHLWDRVRGTVVILHPSGLWVEIDALCYDDTGPAAAAEIAAAMDAALVSGLVGWRMVEVTSAWADQERTFSARLVGKFGSVVVTFGAEPRL